RAVPRRADGRARPAHPPRVARRDRRPARAERDDAPAHDALPRRGGTALRPHRDHARRPNRRSRHARGAARGSRTRAAGAGGSRRRVGGRTGATHARDRRRRRVRGRLDAHRPAARPRGRGGDRRGRRPRSGGDVDRHPRTHPGRRVPATDRRPSGRGRLKGETMTALAPTATLARRRFQLTARTPRELFVPLLTPIMFALVIAPALKAALHTDAAYESFVAIGTVGLLIPLNTMFAGLRAIVDRESGAQ